MIGTSRGEYLFMRAAIAGLHYFVPLCILYCAAVAFYGLDKAFFRLPLLIEIYVAAEALFYFVVYLPYSYYLQRDAIHPPPLSPEERKVLFQLCNDNVSDPENYFLKWFQDADMDEIKRENLKDFLLWAFFNRGGPPSSDDEELERYIAAAEKLLGKPFEPGRGSAKAVRLTLDRVDMLHRSLMWYSCIWFIDYITFRSLRQRGFQFHRTAFSRFFKLFPLRPQALFTKHRSPVKHTTYWYRPHTSRTKLPVVFIHGIGIGLYPYIKLLSELNSLRGAENDPDDQIGIIAIEIMQISSRLTNHALSRQVMCDEISTIVASHFLGQKFVLASHSYGTVISTYLLKSSLAPQIGPVVLIDPVTILLHLPDVAYNFTIKKPKEANEHQLHYFGSMDMGIAHTLGRHFFWSECVLWKNDVAGRDVTVCLGSRDLIVDTEAVGRYLNAPMTKFERELVRKAGVEQKTNKGDATSIEAAEQVGGLRQRGEVNEPVEDEGEEWKSRDWKGTGLEILWFNGLDHAQVLGKSAMRRRVVTVIRRYCEAG